MARAVKSKVRRGVKTATTKTKKPKAKPARVKAAAKAVAPKKVVAQVITEKVLPEESKKKLSEKLLATIEKRKAEQAKKAPAFSKPRGRRGRRPKNMVDYQPYSEDQQQEDPYAYPAENENLEYDTGIRVSGYSGGGGATMKEDGSISMDRVEDFDEELNFDW